VPVISVLVSPGAHVVVTELTKFGVQPVTLSMVAVAPIGESHRGRIRFEIVMTGSR